MTDRDKHLMMECTGYQKFYGFSFPAARIDRNGERGGTRTHDPLIKSQLLYQLSYAPTRGPARPFRRRAPPRRPEPRQAGPAGQLLKPPDQSSNGPVCLAWPTCEGSLLKRFITRSATRGVTNSVIGPPSRAISFTNRDEMN